MSSASTKNAADVAAETDRAWVSSVLAFSSKVEPVDPRAKAARPSVRSTTKTTTAVPIAQQHETAESQHIGVLHPGQIRTRKPKVCPKFRQCRVYHGPVEDHHQLAGQDDGKGKRACGQSLTPAPQALRVSVACHGVSSQAASGSSSCAMSDKERPISSRRNRGMVQYGSAPSSNGPKDSRYKGSQRSDCSISCSRLGSC
jgi:hypothetical protein